MKTQVRDQDKQIGTIQYRHLDLMTNKSSNKDQIILKQAPIDIQMNF